MDEIRKDFKETAKKGKGSFSFYLGFFKRMRVEKVYEIWSEVKDLARKHPALDKRKVFWSRIGELARTKDKRLDKK